MKDYNITATIVDFFTVVEPHNIEKFVKKGTLQIDDYGDYEKLCRKCGEHWPFTSEFWYIQKNESIKSHCWCKACYRSIRREREANK